MRKVILLAAACVLVATGGVIVGFKVGRQPSRRMQPVINYIAAMPAPSAGKLLNVINLHRSGPRYERPRGGYDLVWKEIIVIDVSGITFADIDKIFDTYARYLPAGLQVEGRSGGVASIMRNVDGKSFTYGGGATDTFEWGATGYGQGDYFSIHARVNDFDGMRRYVVNDNSIGKPARGQRILWIVFSINAGGFADVGTWPVSSKVAVQ